MKYEASIIVAVSNVRTIRFSNTRNFGFRAVNIMMLIFWMITKTRRHNNNQKPLSSQSSGGVYKVVEVEFGH